MLQTWNTQSTRKPYLSQSHYMYYRVLTGPLSVQTAECRQCAWIVDFHLVVNVSLTPLWPTVGGLVICELRTANWRTGNMRTNSANYGREPRVQCDNHKVRTFYAIKRGQYRCLCIRNAEMTFITIQNAERNQLVYMLQKYHKTTRVRCGGNYLHYTGPTYMPNQRSVVSALRAVGNL